MHVFGWTREEAVQYMREHTTISENILYGEIDRYITWPGQATAYYLGMNEILNAREYAKQKLSSKFSLSEFNDFVLKLGPIPLDTMFEEVKVWVNQKL